MKYLQYFFEEKNFGSLLGNQSLLRNFFHRSTFFSFFRKLRKKFCQNYFGETFCRVKQFFYSKYSWFSMVLISIMQTLNLQNHCKLIQSTSNKVKKFPKLAPLEIWLSLFDLCNIMSWIWIWLILWKHDWNLAILFPLQISRLSN